MSESATRESVVAELMAEAAPAPEIEKAPVPDAPEEAAEPDTDPIPEDDQSSDLEAPETASDEGEEQPEPEAPAIEAPHFWSAEAKARFGELPPDLQLVVLENEKAGSKALTLKLEEAAAIRKEATARAKELSALNARIADAAIKAERAMTDRWAGMTPEAWLRLAHDDPAKYTKYKAQFDAEQTIVQQAQFAKEDAERVARSQWRDEQVEALKTACPPLVDPVQGTANLGKLSDYLVSQGVAEQDLPSVGALEMTVAWKAMQFDELQKLKPTLKSQPKSALRPAAAPPAIPSAQREIQTLKNRFAQTSSREDLVALMLAEGRAKGS
jgi:hypothetical protein